MSQWEYKVVPAPTKGTKAHGVKGPEGRFANALQSLMNDMGREGWEYQRAETLPSIERSGLTGSTTEWRNVLVFRRAMVDAIDDFEPELLPAPTPETAVSKKPADPPMTAATQPAAETEEAGAETTADETNAQK
ncbi:MAG: DUF4177 domain-containing protein [Tateyamaria sp.]|uniref:DUF4177 domain-containing protein n=1 Tax=Tateyamaria sp. TaxID=1929288 RepID=UPI0032DE09A3